METHQSPALNFAHYALRPFIDDTTMKTHHGRYHKTDVTSRKGTPPGIIYKSLSCRKPFKAGPDLPSALHKKAGWHYKHALFVALLLSTPPDDPIDKGIIAKYQLNRHGVFKNKFARFILAKYATAQSIRQNCPKQTADSFTRSFRKSLDAFT